LVSEQWPILDLRDAQAFLAGHLPGAASIPLEELPRRMHELPPKGRGLRLFHSDPSRANEARILLQSRGYQSCCISFITNDLQEYGPAQTRLWQPSPFMVEAWQLAKPLLPDRPKVLDLGCGSGRESVYLALQGCQVDAVDILPDALEKAQALAQGSGVPIRTLCQDLTRPSDLPGRPYDLVLLFRFIDRDLIRRIPDILSPAGLVIIEGFHARDVAAAQAGRKPAKLLQDRELASMLPGMHSLVSRDAVEREGRWFSQLAASKLSQRG
jgi:tellurite methyltransferase